jgi:hypothetical protein
MDRLYDTRKPLSPHRLSADLGENLKVVKYHIKVLDRASLIEPVVTREVRGSAEVFYRPMYPCDVVDAIVEGIEATEELCAARTALVALTQAMPGAK